MSKIGKRPIGVPTGIDVKFADGIVTVTGPKGTLTREIPAALVITVADGAVNVALTDEASAGRKGAENAPLWGLYRALIQNMVVGVSEGFSKQLELSGVGYKAVLKGSDLELSLGFSHPVEVKAPEGITFAVEKNIVTVSGIDRELVGFIAAKIRALKTPDPYKAHGVKYVGEHIKIKAGKKASATA